MHCNGVNGYFFAKIHELKAKDSEIVAKHFKNISKDFSVDNMKTNGLKGYVYDFSVDYDASAIGNMLDIHKYLMKKLCISNVWVY